MEEAASTVDVDKETTIVPVPDPGLVGMVIGKQGRTITKLMGETLTYIHFENETNRFIIEGEEGNRYSAKLKVKEIISNGLMSQTHIKCWRFPFTDSNGKGFVLQPVHFGGNKAFKVILKDSALIQSSSNDYSSLSRQITNVLRSIYDERKDNEIINIWSHFGHIYVSNVYPEEERIEFNAEDLLSHVKWDNNSDTTKWRTKFVGGIVNDAEPNNLDGWMRTRDEKDPPFIRYEFVYFTPSCRVVRVKIFLGLDVTTNSVTYKNIPKCEPVTNIIRSSDSYPYFYLCGSTVKRALVDVYQPADELDFRFIVDSGSTSQTQDADEEVAALFDFIRDNINIIPDVGLELRSENMPSDFNLRYARVSERRTYPFASEDGEQFTVKLSYEHIVNTPAATSETTVDIHLQYDEWDKMLEDRTWDPQKIVCKIPQFMRCASSLARILKFQDRIPEEISARGPRAQLAYEIALKSGKVKYLRVPVVLIGQSGAGKTSLLRSLKREKFNPNEDSTEGVRLHRSLSMAEEDDWQEDVTLEESLVDCKARAVAEKLSGADFVMENLAPGEDDYVEEPQDQQEEGGGGGEGGNDVVRAEDNNNSATNIEKETENVQEAFCAEEFDEQPSEANKATLSFLGDSFESQIPEEVSEKASSILQNPNELQNKYCIHLVTLDFAGQPVYNATHPVFLPKKAIYILVNNLENEIHAKATPIVKHGSLERRVDDHCPMTNMDYLEFWLSFVASLWTPEGVSIIDDEALDLLRSGGTTTEEPSSTPKGLNLPKRMPPLFLVSTHADIPFNGKDAKEMARQIFHHLKKDKDAPGGNHIVRGIYPVNNTVSGESEEKTIQELRKHIYQVARNLPQVDDVVPIRWLQFEKQLTDLAVGGNKKSISLDEAKTVAVQCQIATDTDEFTTVLNYLHDLKVVIYFEDTDLIIIDIQWLLDMFVKVITVKPIEDWENEYEESWEKLENDGILDRVLIDHLWENEATADSLIMIMERFSLLCRWKRSDGPDIFLVPSMLMNSNATEANALLSDQKTSRTLVVRFKGTHLPLGIFPRLLVIIAKTCNEKWPNSPRPNFYHNFCRFYDVGGETGRSFDLLVTSDMKTISLSVINEHGIMGLPLKQLCHFLVDFLDKTLNTMRSSFPWMKNIEYEFCIRCPKCCPSSKSCKNHKVTGCTRDACLHFITEYELRNKQSRCYRNEASNITFFVEEIYCDWFDTTADKETNTTQVVVENIQSLALDDKPSTSEGIPVGILYDNVAALDELSRCLDRAYKHIPYWKHFANVLKVDSNVIRQCELKSEISPTIKLFDFLQATRPDLLVKELKGALEAIQRFDICTMISRRFEDEDRVSEVITDSSTDILDEIALKLDSVNKPIGNWESLARTGLKILRKVYRKFEMYSDDCNPTIALVQYLYATRDKPLLFKDFMDCFHKMDRKDVINAVENRFKLEDIKDQDASEILKVGSELLQNIADLLNKDVIGVKGWQGLGEYFGVEVSIIKTLESLHNKEVRSPTKILINWLSVARPSTTISDVMEALKMIKRNDAVRILQRNFGFSPERMPQESSSSVLISCQSFTLGVEERLYDLSPLGVLLKCPPNAVPCPTEIKWRKLSPQFCPSPAEDNETLVSYIVELGPSSVKLQEPLTISLTHSGPSRKDGYETIVKMFESGEGCEKWKEVLWEKSRGQGYSETECLVQVRIDKLVSLAVVSRLVTDHFEVTKKGCLVRSSVCDDVTVEFPEGALDRTVNASMKLLLMPSNIDPEIEAYPGPVILIHGFQDVHFKVPVKIRLPHPHSSGYSSGKVRVFRLQHEEPSSHNWKDITGEVHYVEEMSYVELHVNHFCGYWVWIYEVQLPRVTSFFKHLLYGFPQAVCFAAFKETNDSQSSEETSDSLNMTLVCVPNNEQKEITATMKDEGYTRLALSTADELMRPFDKAYTKVEGCYRKKTTDEFFLQFLKDDICRKELPLLREEEDPEEEEEDQEDEQGARSRRTRRHSEAIKDLVLSFSAKLEEPQKKHYLCKFVIDKAKVIPRKFEEERSDVNTTQVVAGIVQLLALKNRPSASAGSPCQEIVQYGVPGQELSLPGNSVMTFARLTEIVEELKPYKSTVKDPPAEIVKECRDVCRHLRGPERKKYIEELRKYLPSGMTGPRADENKLYNDMEGRMKQELTRTLCRGDVCRRMAEIFGKQTTFDYYDHQKNPVEELLRDVCQQRRLTFGELYDTLVSCDANEIADSYL